MNLLRIRPLRLIVLTSVLTVLAASMAGAAPSTNCPDPTGGKCRIPLSTGITMAYIDTGPGQGLPLILIHGFTDSLHTWKYALGPLRQAHPDWRILAVDLRGHGASSMPPAAECAAAPERCFRVSDHAADVIAFMSAMGIPRANIVGHSLGSLITQEIALSNPAMVERAVLIATSTTVVNNPVIHDFLERDTIEATWKPAIEEKGKLFPQDLYGLPLRDISPKVVEWVTTTWGADPVENADWVAEYVQNTLSMPAGTWVGVARAVQLFDSSGRLDGLKVPTLVVWGTQAVCSRVSRIRRRSRRRLQPPPSQITRPTTGSNTVPRRCPRRAFKKTTLATSWKKTRRICLRPILVLSW